MCDYCQREIDLNNQIYRLTKRLHAITPDGGADDRAVIDALARANAALTSLDEMAVADPEACALWRMPVHP